MWQIISIWLGIFIMGICEIIFAKIILQKDIKVPKYLLLLTLLITSIIYTINNICLVGTLKTLIVCIVHVITFKYLFKINWSKSFLLTFLYAIILAITELFEIFVFTKIIGISKITFYNKIAGNILGNITIGVLFVIFTYFIRNILRKIININVQNHTKIILSSILTLICTGMFFYTIIKKFEFSDDIILYLISITVLLTVLFSLIKQTIENNKLTEQYDKLLEFMKQYEQEAEKQRILRHETKNEFLAIKAKLYDKQKNKEVIEYIDEILKDKIELKQEEFAKFVYLPANGIKGLCYFKTQEAKDKGLNTSINISKRVENSNIYKLSVKEQRDLGKILGVFLDNAIEASLNSKAKEFGLEAYLNIKKECEIIISNSYDGELEVDKIGKEKFSTKGKNRGHGLLLVNHLVSKNDKFAINTKITNGLYIQTLTIKKITKKNEHQK